jgi:hypothetical protein
MDTLKKLNYERQLFKQIVTAWYRRSALPEVD